MNARVSKQNVLALLTRGDRNRRSGLLAVAAILILLLASSCGAGEPQASAGLEEPGEVSTQGASAVAYNAVDATTGEPVSMDDLLGRPAIVSSWATWCAPCRRELPALERLHQEQPKDGLQVVIVNLDTANRDEKIINDMVEELGLTMTQWRDGADNFTMVFKGFGLPMSVLVDANGEIVHTWHGAINPDSDNVRAILADYM